MGYASVYLGNYRSLTEEKLMNQKIAYEST